MPKKSRLGLGFAREQMLEGLRVTNVVACRSAILSIVNGYSSMDLKAIFEKEFEIVETLKNLAIIKARMANLSQKDVDKARFLEKLIEDKSSHREYLRQDVIFWDQVSDAQKPGEVLDTQYADISIVNASKKVLEESVEHLTEALKVCNAAIAAEKETPKLEIEGWWRMEHEVTELLVDLGRTKAQQIGRNYELAKTVFTQEREREPAAPAL